MKLSGKTAIITGCASGMGKATAQLFCSDGAQVVLNDLSDQVFTLERELQAQGYEVAAVQGSAADMDIAEKAAQTAVDRFGKIDILINTVGLSCRTAILDTSLEEFERVINTNLKAVFCPCKAVLPYMIERQYGRIVNISSVAGLRGGGLLGKSTYAASKGGVTALSKGIAREVAKYGITCNVICPGFTMTPRTKDLPEEEFQRVLSAIPLGRGGQVNEITPMILLLASDDAGFITGTIHVIDGGTSMT